MQLPAVGLLRSVCGSPQLQLYSALCVYRLQRLNSSASATEKQQAPGRPPSRRQLQQTADDTLSEALTSRRAWAPADFDSLLAEYRRAVPSASADMVDHKVLRICQRRRDLATARALVAHRQSCQGQMPLANLAAYLEVCGLCSDECGDSELLETYSRLKDMTLDQASTARLVEGLCASRHWRLALAHLPALRQRSQPPVGSVSAAVTAAFRHGADDTGWQLIHQLAEDLLRPEDRALDAWIARCEQHCGQEALAELAAQTATAASAGRRQVARRPPTSSLDLLERLLEYLAHTGVVLNVSQATELLDIFTSRLPSKWRGEATHVSNGGRCESCGWVFPEHGLSDADFQLLREAVTERLLIGEDVFQHSTPQEVERFRAFVQRTAPYDIVVDGLNVSFTMPRKAGNPLTRALVHVVDHFAVGQQKKMLIIGRHHMNGWKKKDMGYVKQHALLFTADNMTGDDTFLLYAVMHSHPRTQFVTRDYFRDHAARLPADLRSKLNQLVRSNRIEVAGVSPQGNLNLNLPIQHRVAAQRDQAGGWHVPFSDQSPAVLSLVTPSPVRPVTDRWLCLRPP